MTTLAASNEEHLQMLLGRARALVWDLRAPAAGAADSKVQERDALFIHQLLIEALEHAPRGGAAAGAAAAPALLPEARLLVPTQRSRAALAAPASAPPAAAASDTKSTQEEAPGPHQRHKRSIQFNQDDRAF